MGKQYKTFEKWAAAMELAGFGEDLSEDDFVLYDRKIPDSYPDCNF